MAYRAEAAALDAEILALIDRWHRFDESPSDAEFNDLALRVFEHQLRYNEPYARYCATFGVSPRSMPESWHDIPAVPADAYKEAALCTFDPLKAELVFETSGTTRSVGGRHYMETRSLYDAALLAGFDQWMLADAKALRYMNFVPNPAERPHSSLGYMMNHVSVNRGDGETGWYLYGDEFLFDAFLADAAAAIEQDVPVCVATTAFALVHVLDAMRERDITLALPNGSRILETGGFKGRSRTVDRADLYAEASARFRLHEFAIVAEYGMTELTSQYYDDALLRQDPGVRYKSSPPWLRGRVVGPDGKTLPDGTVGALVHVDLANRSSCVAIQTEDLGAQFERGLVLIGREAGATLRGCSLDAEELVRR